MDGHAANTNTIRIYAIREEFLTSRFMGYQIELNILIRPALPGVATRVGDDCDKGNTFREIQILKNARHSMLYHWMHGDNQIRTETVHQLSNIFTVEAIERAIWIEFINRPVIILYR